MDIRTVYLIVVGISGVIFSSCKSANTPPLQNDYPEFNPLETTQIVNEFDDYIEDVEFLPLITPDSIPIYGVKKLLITDNDKKEIVALIGDKVVKFDSDGNMLFDIGRKGRGPGEYLYVKDICFNENQTELWILCQSRIVMKYSLDTGRYIASVRDDKAPHTYPFAISPAEDGGFFLFEPNPMNLDITNMEGEYFCLKQYDSRGKLIRDLIPPTDFNLNLAILPSITKSYDNTYLLMPQENENICYEIKDGVISRLCKIHFGRENIKPLYAYSNGNNPSDNLVPIIKSGYYKYPSTLHKTKEHLFFIAIGPDGRQDNFVVGLDDFEGIHWHDRPDYDPSAEPFYILGSDDTYLYGVFNYFGEYTEERIAKFDPLVSYLMRKHNIRLAESANPAIIKLKFSNL